MNDELSKRLDKYLGLTEKALNQVKKKKIEKGKELLDLAERYFEDAKYFRNKKDLINAFAAINYSHAFLDAGAVLKLFKVSDNKLFMVD